MYSQNKHNKVLIFATMILIILSNSLFAQNYSMTSQVDKEEVGFGDSLNLVVTITQDTGGSFGNRMTVPSIKEIPNFDIASTRTAQNHQWINGVGQATVQLIYELVPQNSGTFNIPSFSMKGPDGKDYKTDPIEVKVLPPPTEEPDAEENTAADASINNKNGLTLFNGLLVFGVFIALLVSIPIALSAFMNKNKVGSEKLSEDEVSTLVSKSEKEKRNVVEEAVFSTKTDEQIDFNREVERLKMTDPEISNSFYRSYFNLFIRAVVTKHASLSTDMTPDELLSKIADFPDIKNIAEIPKRLGNDIDIVIFANSLPQRSFGEIDRDTREILNKIS